MKCVVRDTHHNRRWEEGFTTTTHGLSIPPKPHLSRRLLPWAAWNGAMATSGSLPRPAHLRSRGRHLARAQEPPNGGLCTSPAVACTAAAFAIGREYLDCKLLGCIFSTFIILIIIILIIPLSFCQDEIYKVTLIYGGQFFGL